MTILDHDLPSRPANQVDAICLSCGAVRKVSGRYLSPCSTRPLACAGCGHATDHEPVDRGPWGSHAQNLLDEETRVAAELLRRLDATKALIEQFGIRLKYRHDLRCTTEKGKLRADAMTAAERGPGWCSWTIVLDADLTLADQLRCLDECWRNITPAAWPGWMEPWFEDEEDPQVSCVSMIIPRSGQ